MITELATLYVKPNRQKQFETDFEIAGQYISSIDGYISHSLQKCVEQDDKYILLVSWRSLDDHTIGFRKSEVYLKWKELLHHYYDPFPVVEHFETIIENKK
ncbi:antibiotic biosynthesis monooxygenase [Pedobacter sp. HMF7647]|uniref:Antibiotic biosynthesis monooxygenase n=1 Tax=Hufsiella arboris TaxID=2695275 RepID=A0A7K1Y844_9SPHI|nr:antibiotic biosynthesis monooxygenase [Hufsiella arboris]MXV50752.1 antibiotic biosynthesis monooxygenase [Hufsiella arboris]